MTSHSNLNWRAKAPQLLIIAVIAIALAIVLFDMLEDVLLESGLFSGKPLAMLFNAVATLTESLTAAVQSWGYLTVFGLMVLESSSLPIPSEIILPFAGFLVSQGSLSFWLVVCFLRLRVWWMR